MSQTGQEDGNYRPSWQVPPVATSGASSPRNARPSPKAKEKSSWVWALRAQVTKEPRLEQPSRRSPLGVVPEVSQQLTLSQQKRFDEEDLQVSLALLEKALAPVPTEEASATRDKVVVIQAQGIVQCCYTQKQ
ncbi:unnamed protein product [Polarella glacialis]|uniref:Uncharacterized protein n=1 Tax=Polarella glacialis TaxID=89957 RepID=A0A813I107_POLGL|nr:unnamed protein product [Polarella glacialis]